MHSIENLINAIVKPLLDYPEELVIEQVETEEFMEYHLHVNPEDVGRIIGKKGRVARAIRTIVYSMKTRQRKRARIVIADQAQHTEA